MRVWRVCQEKYATDLSGEGARLNGARWNSPGVAMVYAAESPALAALEVRVHLDLPPDLIPDDYALVEIDVPDVAIETFSATLSNPSEAGDAWVASRSSLALRVPSFVMIRSFNVLINPNFAGPDAARITRREPFEFDERLWLPLRRK